VQIQLHTIEAVQAELIEGGLGLQLVIGQGPAEFVGDHMRDRFADLRFDQRCIDFLQAPQLGELERAATEQEVIRHIGRLLRPVILVVPRFQPRI